MAERVYGLPSYGAKEWTLRVVMGPQDDCFTDKGINTFLNSIYTISNEYDRMGKHRKVHRDHIGDLCVAACGLMVRHHDDRISVGRNLNRDLKMPETKRTA